MNIPMVVAVPLLIAAGIATALAWWALLRRRKAPSTETIESIEMTCTLCRRQLVFSPNELEPLSAPEMGLVVGAKPRIVRRRLADYTCPYCEAAHCFAVDCHPPEWVGVNLYQPRESSVHCFECHQPLKRLPGASGGLTEKVEDISALEPEMGLKCPRCHSICCVRCCRRTSRGRTRDESVLCPRCNHGPVDLLYYP